MKHLWRVAPLLATAACSHHEYGPPGYWFLIIFIFIPLIIILVKVFMDFGAMREALYSLESRFRGLDYRLDELDEKLKKMAQIPQHQTESKKEG
jgi:hypothetical protein